ncbi:MAG: hypothetical protein HC933_04155 [Pleurocapsa sp. SU_196_0]|nr:hypothetical protein [Pleurocapsa sp. SU_196_0]
MFASPLLQARDEASFITRCFADQSAQRHQNQFTESFDLTLARLSDDSAEVRTAAATVLHDWATRVGRGALDVLLEHESGERAREVLLKAQTSLEN